MPLVVRSVELPNGVTLPYLERGDASGVPLILLHGIADSCRIFEPILPHLPESVRAIAPSLRGHGDASRPRSGYRPGDFATDLAAFMLVLEIGSAVVAGASSGGVIARRFAIDHPDRTVGLVLLGAPFSLRDKPGVQEMWDSTFSKLKDPIDSGLVRGFAEATIGSSGSPELFEVLVEENLKAPAHVWKETMRGLLDDDSTKELGSIRSPTLVMWGDQDSILPRSDQEGMIAAIPGARLVEYPAGHMFYLEHPARVAADLVAFIEALDR